MLNVNWTICVMMNEYLFSGDDDEGLITAI